MKFEGLTKAEVEQSRKQNGSNALTQIPPESLWEKILGGFKEDKMIQILCFAAAIQLGL